MGRERTKKKIVLKKLLSVYTDIYNQNDKRDKRTFFLDPKEKKKKKKKNLKIFAPKLGARPTPLWLEPLWYLDPSCWGRWG